GRARSGDGVQARRNDDPVDGGARRAHLPGTRSPAPHLLSAPGKRGDRDPGGGDPLRRRHHDPEGPAGGWRRGETRRTRKRAGGPQDPAIVGVWSTPHETGQTAFLLYTSDGRVVFRLPIRADPGRWSATGDHLSLPPGSSAYAP